MIKKYNLSPKRVLSRTALTILVSIIFFIAMFPFMRIANGLLYEQRAAIGAENMFRVVVLWAIFTSLFSFITFWKKRFRMTSIFLIVCWVLGTAFYLLIHFGGDNDRCNRSYPYEMPGEFNRALDLIAQRMDIENNYGNIQGYAFLFRNCLNIQYADMLSEEEGLFLVSDSEPQNLKILVKDEYRSYDDLTIATLLMHELTHAGQYLWEHVYNENGEEVRSCVDQEAQAFVSQQILMGYFNEEERRSIFARIAQDVDSNPAFPILLQLDEITGESYNACLNIKDQNNLTDEQFNQCVWTGAENNIKAVIEEDSYYKNQCNL